MIMIWQTGIFSLYPSGSLTSNCQNPCHHTFCDEGISGAAEGFPFVRHILCVMSMDAKISQICR